MEDTNSDYGISFDGDYIVKIVLIGDSGVGKSCLLTRFADNSFTDSFTTTIGVDFKTRTIDLDGKRIKIQMWDTAGQERYRAIVNCYYRGAHGVLVVYDVTNENSFKYLDRWLDQVKRYAEKDVKTLLVGNKCDLTSERVVEYNTAKDYADGIGIPLIETSAKNSANVDQAIVLLVNVIMNQMTDGHMDSASDINLEPSTPVGQKTWGCC